MTDPSVPPNADSMLEDAPIAHWPDLVAPLFHALSTDQFGDAFFDSINRISPIDSAIVMLFKTDHEPIVLFERLHPAEQKSFHNIYLSGAYLLSPLYQRFTTLRSGFYRLGALEEQDVELSDFGIAYFNKSGLCDDANFLHKLNDGTALVASFGRQQLSSPFSAQELQQLHVADPVYRAALARHWDSQRLAMTTESKPIKGSHNQLKNTLRDFANSILTEREHTVLQLMLAGKSSKVSAIELGISIDTERGHRKNIYTKLNVTSQAQLFSLIFTVLAEVHVETGVDAYAVYINQRRSR